MASLGKKTTMDCARLLVGTLLLLLLVSSIGAEATMCETRSKLHKGPCFKNNKCDSICKKEGFVSGKCSRFRRRCMCAEECDDDGDSNNSTPEHLLH